MKSKSISTKVANYQVSNQVPSIYTNKNDNEAEFSCSGEGCINCFRCELGCNTMDLIYGGL